VPAPAGVRPGSASSIATRARHASTALEIRPLRVITWAGPNSCGRQDSPCASDDSGLKTSFTWSLTGIGTLLSDGDRYLWGHGPIGRIDANSAATYAHQDGLGTVRLITDATGAVVGSSASDAFGAQRATSGVHYRLGFTGEQLDAETGLVYLRAR
jgi:hypothetical protein